MHHVSWLLCTVEEPDLETPHRGNFRDFNQRKFSNLYFRLHGALIVPAMVVTALTVTAMTVTALAFTAMMSQQ